MKVLNLYAGIGGNRKLWEDVEVTAVELNEEIAKVYQDYFPDDKVIIGDAHQYLLDHYSEYDFIWSSPPCQSHSDIRRMGVAIGQNAAIFPDMKLWQEIVFLKHHHQGLWIVENVKPYYQPFIYPDKEIDRHFFWTNFLVSYMNLERKNRIKNISSNTIHFGYDLSGYKINKRKDQILRNMVNPDLGLHILDCARGIIRKKNEKQLEIF